MKQSLADNYHVCGIFITHMIFLFSIAVNLYQTGRTFHRPQGHSPLATHLVMPDPILISYPEKPSGRVIPCLPFHTRIVNVNTVDNIDHYCKFDHSCSLH